MTTSTGRPVLAVPAQGVAHLRPALQPPPQAAVQAEGPQRRRDHPGQQVQPPVGLDGQRGAPRQVFEQAVQHCGSKPSRPSSDNRRRSGAGTRSARDPSVAPTARARWCAMDAAGSASRRPTGASSAAAAPDRRARGAGRPGRPRRARSTRGGRAPRAARAPRRRSGAAAPGAGTRASDTPGPRAGTPWPTPPRACRAPAAGPRRRPPAGTAPAPRPAGTRTRWRR